MPHSFARWLVIQHCFDCHLPRVEITHWRNLLKLLESDELDFFIADIRELVADLKTRGIGVLITDHNVRETLEIVDRAYILHDGAVLMSGTAQEVVADPDVRRVYLGEGFRM